MYILQCGLTADFELERHKWGVISFSAGYMFEYIYNKGVDSNIYVKDSSVAAGSGSPVVDDDARALVASQKQRWIDNFSNQFNNYFMIAVKYSY